MLIRICLQLRHYFVVNLIEEKKFNHMLDKLILHTIFSFVLELNVLLTNCLTGKCLFVLFTGPARKKMTAPEEK